jgi:hypothetical protein
MTLRPILLLFLYTSPVSVLEWMKEEEEKEVQQEASKRRPT